MKLKNRLNRIVEHKIYRESIQVICYCFTISLITYLLLLLIETIWEKSVSGHFNMNILMIVVIIFAIIVTLTQPDIKEEGEHEKPSKKSTIFSVCIGIGGVIIIWYKTNEIGWLSYLVSIIGGSMITLISLMIMRENGLKNEKPRMDNTNNGRDESGNHPKLESREKNQSPH
ncbi:hypothetical protein ACFLXY_10355 [Chloroflexota bacterium]